MGARALNYAAPLVPISSKYNYCSGMPPFRLPNSTWARARIWSKPSTIAWGLTVRKNIARQIDEPMVQQVLGKIRCGGMSCCFEYPSQKSCR